MTRFCLSGFNLFTFDLNSFSDHDYDKNNEYGFFPFRPST